MRPSKTFKRIAPLLYECIGYSNFRIKQVRHTDLCVLYTTRTLGFFWFPVHTGTWEECNKKFLEVIGEQSSEKKI